MSRECETRQTCAATKSIMNDSCRNVYGYHIRDTDISSEHLGIEAQKERNSAITSASNMKYITHNEAAEFTPSVPPTLNNRAKFSRVLNCGRRMQDATCDFFGLQTGDKGATHELLWMERRQRLAIRAYGRLNSVRATVCSNADVNVNSSSVSICPEKNIYRKVSSSVVDSAPNFSVDHADNVNATSTLNYIRRKPHVLRIVLDGLIAFFSVLFANKEPDKNVSSDNYEANYRVHLSEYSAPSTFELSKSSSKSLTQPLSTSQMAPDYTSNFDTVDNNIRSRASRDAEFFDELFFDRVYDNNTSRYRSGFKHHDTSNRYWQRYHLTSDAPQRGHRRIANSLLERVFDNSHRRTYGRGLLLKLFGFKMDKSVISRPEIKAQINDIDDHRPYFTYWVTFVQLLVMFTSLVCYGFGPIGFELRQQSGRVLDISLSLQQVDYWEPPNIWLGPRAADLIHLGAKFAPCMRRDTHIYNSIAAARSRERDTACCVRNDNSGCVQSISSQCSNTISRWQKWGGHTNGPDGRTFGSVCGQDPRYCLDPKSQVPNEWPEDISKWPICNKPIIPPQGSTVDHMVCEVIGRPCCVGIHGRCQISTREYCDFVNGYFHDEASLCSQVSCLNEVCGMMPFYDPDTPDQFYRLWTSLFLHAGIIHIVFTVIVQFYFLRDLEKMAGTVRISIIYILSGIGGNLASAIFIPFRADVGPAGSQFGLLACHFVELFHVWPALQTPWRAFCRLFSLLCVLLIIGLLPWVDNYAHVFGFLVGFLLSFALLPYISFGVYDRSRKRLLILLCLCSLVLLLVSMALIFYLVPLYRCVWCEYFDCVPVTRDFCAEQNIEFNRHVDL